MSRARRRKLSLLMLAGAVPVALVLATAAGPADAATVGRGPQGLLAHTQASSAAPTTKASDDTGNETEDLLDRSEQYAAIRTAPGISVSAEAFQAAQRQAAALPSTPGTWKELTTKPYDSDALNYRDAFWSNGGGGAGLVSGRMTAITSDGDTVYAGAADGGVWRSTDKGGTWTPIFDKQTRLSVGAIAVNPADHSLWVGTGEANTNADGYNGDGIYRSTDRGASWHLVGHRLDNSLVSRIVFDGVGNAYAATSRGLKRHSSTTLGADWDTVLKPDPNPTGSPYRQSWISDVRVRPGTNGQEVIAVLGWRGGTLPADISYNGFYVSTTGGVAGSFSKVATPGIVGAIGRTSLDYNAGGGKLYAVIEDPTIVNFNGVYRSETGTAAGPWTLLADSAELSAAPGTATTNPGSQAWYDQYVTVDPKDGQHIYLGLKEVYESNNGGDTWTTIGPYWNITLPCYSIDPAKDTCPDTTHPDQHAAYVAPDGTAYFGNDGGLYSRPAALRTVVKWNDLNATLRTLQYYSAGVGSWPGGGDAVWGGLQDNGTSLLKPDAPKMVSPFGGDGGVLLVDPANAQRAVNEYVYLAMARTENGGRAAPGQRSYTNITPTCRRVIALEFDPQPCDPNPRFIAPYVADVNNIDHWVAGGQRIWDNRSKGWDTVCDSTHCNWNLLHDLGAGAQTTALGVNGKTIYAGWCGNTCNPAGPAGPFVSGIDTNYGGTWHRVSAPNLPNRIPTAFKVDAADPAHVFVTYGAFSRRWIPGAGVGHVFESTDGGATWADRSGDLPDIPVNDVERVGNTLIVGTDVGVFSTDATAPGSWQRMGSGLPNASTNDLALAPNNTYVVAATHGRGLWTFDLG